MWVRCLMFVLFFTFAVYMVSGQSVFSLASFQEGKAIKLMAFANGDSLGANGIAFTIKIDSTYYIVTNRHIVEERDFYTKVSSGHGVPNFVTCTFITYPHYHSLSFKIRDNSQELFYGNVYNSESTDIIAIPIGDNPIDLNQSIDYKSTYSLKLGDEVFAISIIETAGGTGVFTMFSKIISDPQKDFKTEYGVLPVVLIERGSLSGMSGSPVFVWPNKNEPPVFVGILAGNNGTENAFFWRKDILDDLVKSIRQK